MTCPVSLFHEVATLVLVHLLTCPGLEAGGIHGIQTRCLLPRAKSKGSSWGREEGILTWGGERRGIPFSSPSFGDKRFTSLVLEGPYRAGLVAKLRAAPE